MKKNNSLKLKNDTREIGSMGRTTIEPMEYADIRTKGKLECTTNGPFNTYSRNGSMVCTAIDPTDSIDLVCAANNTYRDNKDNLNKKDGSVECTSSVPLEHWNNGTKLVCAANDSNVKNVRNVSNFSNVSNISNTSIGRPKKKKGFKGTPSKCNSDKGNDHSFIDRSFVRNIFEEPDKHVNNMFSKTSSELNVSDKIIDFRISSLDIIPSGLLNRGENVCFFNSIVQVLYSIPDFLNYVLENVHSNQYVLQISEMFLEIASSMTPVQTSKYIRDLELSNYIFGSQYDAHECLLQILDKIYPSVTDDCLFKISMLESTVCQNNNCKHRAERSTNIIDLELNEISSGAIQNVTNLLSQPQIPSPLEGYRCDGCQVV